MYTSILFPSTSIKVLDLNTVFNTPVGAYIRPSTTSPLITISATTNYHTKNLCSFSSITVPCAGFMDFTLYPDQDLEFSDGVKEIYVILDGNIPSDSNGLVIKDISMKLFEDYS
ncbi:hypothetical protein V8C43DRAFT_289767 [Trichoderma afarasin]